MKTGAPINAVTAPTGNSAGETTLRAIVSASVKYAAPIKKEAGKTILLSTPKTMRQICGTSNPTKPIIPLTETKAPIMMLVKM